MDYLVARHFTLPVAEWSHFPKDSLIPAPHQRSGNPQDREPEQHRWSILLHEQHPPHQAVDRIPNAADGRIAHTQTD
jgi:hypothetical protein